MAPPAPPAEPAAAELMSTDARETGRSWQLTVVAAVFLVAGSGAAWDFGTGGILSLYGESGQPYRVNLSVLAFPIGIGLLRHRPGWRVAAVVFTALTAITGLVTAALSLAGRGRVTARWPGTEQWVISDPWIAVILSGLFTAVAVWMLYVLGRADSRRRFEGRGLDRPWIEWAALVALLMVA